MLCRSDLQLANAGTFKSCGPLDGQFAGRTRLLQCLAWHRSGEAGCIQSAEKRRHPGAKCFLQADPLFGETDHPGCRHRSSGG